MRLPNPPDDIEGLDEYMSSVFIGRLIRMVAWILYAVIFFGLLLHKASGLINGIINIVNALIATGWWFFTPIVIYCIYFKKKRLRDAAEFMNAAYISHALCTFVAAAVTYSHWSRIGLVLGTIAFWCIPTACLSSLIAKEWNGYNLG
jgi:hypothetical protein